MSEDSADRVAPRDPGPAGPPTAIRVDIHDAEAVFPLTPVQHGLLLNSLLAATPGVELLQIHLTLRERLDPAALEEAWRQVVRRHAIFRSSFRWEGLETPVQVVHRNAGVPFRHHDWRGVDAAEQRRRLAGFLREDRLRGFDFAAAPPMRLDLFRTGDAEHELVWTLHHALIDGWSMLLVLREVFARCEGRDAGFPAPPAYQEHAAWLRAQDFARAEPFWRELLRGFDAPTPLPVEATADASAVEYVHRCSRLSAATTSALREAAREHGATLNTVMQAAWALLLRGYGGGDDVVFGAVRACRRSAGPGTELVVGPCLNSVPVRARFAPALAWGDWLRGLRAQNLAVREWEHTPLSRIQECTSIRGGALFDSLVMFESGTATAALRALDAGWAGREVWPLDKPGTPLTVTGYDGAELLVKLSFDPARFGEALRERMEAHLLGLLERIAARPHARLEELSLPGGAERERLLHAWNPAFPAAPAAECIHERFAAQAARAPDAVAVVHGDERVTYRELDERTARLAHHLRARGVGPEVPVALCMERSVDMVVAVVGVLRAGGAYVPLDPEYPAERLDFVLRDSGARVVVTHAAVADRLPAGAAGVVRLDADRAEIERHPASAPEVAVAPENLAYVIYTSGSTGRPKGVQVTHSAAVRLFTSTRDRFGFGADDVWTLFHSYAFDFSVWELFGALLHGGRLVVVPFLTSRDPRRFQALLARERVTVLNQTPSAFRELVRAEEDSPEPAGPALRWVIFGGEALDAAALAPWLDRHGAERPRLVNMYGITETTVHVTFRRIGGADVRRGGRSPIGGPIPDLRLYVLDGAMQPAPLGVPGELYVGGAGLARGYLGRAGLTAERFVPDPFSGGAGERLYRSGDRVRRLADGELEYLGRADAQVKVRGFRIEPGEIEAVLREHPGVADAVVAVREDAPGDRRLVAYVVAAAGADPEGMRGLLRRRLPDHMLPAAVVPLERFPLTPNGKLDRAALPAPEAGAAAGSGYVAPRTALEAALAAIWAEVLRVPRVGVRENFFELGGHSLRATQVASRVRQSLGLELPVRALFEGATVSELAALLEESGAAGAPGAGEPALRPVPRDRPLPLSFAQQRLWFLDQLHPGQPLYNMPAAVRLAGGLDAALLERALAEVVGRHEALRTTFAAGEGGPVQVIAPAGGWTLDRVDLGRFPEEGREAEALRLAGEEAGAPFDLARGPLFRARLVRLAADDHLLLWTTHHSVADGWSTAVLLREASAVYRALARGEAPPLAPLPVQYADYAVWQRERLQGAALEAQLGPWRERLAGAPALLELPTDRPRPAVRGFRGGLHRFRLPAGLVAELTALAHAGDATPFMVLLAAFQLLLGRWSGQDDVVVGTPIAGRMRAELEGLVGLFVNTLALRTGLGGNPPFRELLAAVRRTTLDAYAHQELPFDRLVEELHPERSMSYAPVVQVVFALLNTERVAIDLPGVRASTLPLRDVAAKHDLTLHLEEEDGELHGLMVFDPDLFDPATVERMGCHFVQLLRGVAGAPDTRVLDLPLMPDEEVRGLAAPPAPPSPAYPEARCVDLLFAGQAARTPRAPAVVCEGEVLTYAELDARANRLARHLRALGAGPEVRVAICMERSVDALVALWGVLRAGAAYVPLDPAYPAERLAFMLEDSAAPLLLTQARLLGTLPPSDARPVLLDAHWPDIEREDAGPPAPLATLDTLAYVIYTSGSTGRPKGVLIQHRELLNYVRGFVGRLGVEEGAVFAMVQPFAFDSVVTQIFASALTGGTLHLLSEERSIDSEGLAAYFRASPVDCLKIVPSHLAALLAGSRPADILPRRWLVIGGEGARPDWVRSLQEMRPGLRVFNHYGATETSVAMMMYEAPPEGPLPPTATLPLGRPLPGTAPYVLDPALGPVPAGVAGEVFIGGGCLARGYLERAGLSAERFVPDPFSGVPGARMYRTGDRARRWADGTLEFLGRVDHQVKVRGFRIEPGEVEGALRRVPGVREALALVRPGQGGPRLVAYAVPAAGVRLDGAALRDAVREWLPGHMVPSAVVVLDEMPRTSHGKLDRRALPEPGSEAAADAYAAPRTPTEETLAGMWSATLQVERVGIHDSLFDLGGHSLLATRLASRIRTAFRVELPLRDLFEHPTVAGIAEILERRSGAAGEADLAPIPRRARPLKIPATPTRR